MEYPKERLASKAKEFKKKSKSFPYSRFFLLPLIPVYCGIRKAGSFDGIFPVKKAESLQELCEELSIYNKAISLGENIKVLFAKDKKTLKRLIQLHDRVFIVKTDKKAHQEYGLLLGYPRCCVDALSDSGFSSSSTMHMSLNNPWPWKLNLFSEPPLIHHYPCSSGCKESLEIATKTLDVYSVFAPDLAKAREEHLKPILYFDENIYIRFKGMNKFPSFCSLGLLAIRYDKVDICSPERIEDGYLSRSHKNLLKKLSYFEEGDKIIATDSQIRILKDKTLIFIYKKKSVFDGAFIIFK